MLTQAVDVMVTRILDTMDPATFDYGRVGWVRDRVPYCLIKRIVPEGEYELSSWVRDHGQLTQREVQRLFAYGMGGVCHATGGEGIAEARRRLGLLRARSAWPGV